MKMVAAARLRKAQGRILAARPFAQKMEVMIADLLQRAGLEGRHAIFEKRESPKRVLLLVTSDRGLCGAFNTSLIRETLKYLREHGTPNVRLFVIGRKGRDYFRRYGVNIVKDYAGLNDPSFARAEVLYADLMDAYNAEPVAAVDLLYNEFKSIIQQRIVVKTLLPLTPEAFAAVEHDDPKAREIWPDYMYEPEKRELLRALIPRFLKAQVFRVLLESSAAELGARMSAMENATKNASELVDSLTLHMNRTRQSSITKEILEVVSGAEALK